MHNRGPTDRYNEVRSALARVMASSSRSHVRGVTNALWRGCR